MHKVNRIVIEKENYETYEEFEDAIKAAVMVLLNANYIMTVKYDDKGLGIVCIDYEHDNPEYGSPLPYWLSPEEADSVVWDGDENS